MDKPYDLLPIEVIPEKPEVTAFRERMMKLFQDQLDQLAIPNMPVYGSSRLEAAAYSFRWMQHVEESNRRLGERLFGSTPPAETAPSR